METRAPGGAEGIPERERDHAAARGQKGVGKERAILDSTARHGSDEHRNLQLPGNWDLLREIRTPFPRHSHVDYRFAE